MGTGGGGGKKRKGGNPGVGIDFKKVKHKVGKKLPKAQNETRTDFKARAINLPSQSVGADKGTVAVSDRNLTVQELLNQSGHHSERVRRDALTGLQQLLTSHPAEARRHAAALLEKLAARMTDGDAAVRTALLSLLRTAALPALGAATLSPFLPMLMAHLEAAMTHLEAPVRLDALSALEALASAAPAAFAPSGALLAPCLRHYAALLSRAHRGRSVKAQALSGLSKVVASLRRFLAAALPANDTPSGDGSGSSSSTEGTAAAAAAAGAEAPLMARRCAWGSRPEPLGPAQLLALYAGAGAQLGTQQQQQRQQPKALKALLSQQGQPKPAKAVSKKRKQHIEPGTAQEELAPPTAAATAPGAGAAAAAAAAPAAAAAAAARGSGLAAAQAAGQEVLEALAVCWRECAPATLSASPELEQAQALVDILACSAALVAGLSLLPRSDDASSGALAGDARSIELAARAAAALLPSVVAAFPVTAPAARPAAAVQELLVDFNVRAARLLGAFLSAGVVWPQRPERATPAELAWGGTVLRYIHGVLQTGAAVPAADALSSEIALPTAPAPTARGSTAAAAAAPATAVALPLLQTLQALLPRLCPEDRQPLLAAVGALSGGGSRAGPVRTACLRLQRGLLLRHLREGGGDAAAAADMAEWLRAAPKALWAIGDRAPGPSAVLLSLLYHTAALALPGSPLAAALDEVQPQLAPLLCIPLTTPAAGPGGGAGGGKKKKQGKGKGQQQQAAEAAAAAAAGPSADVPVVIGPLARLPAAKQELSADLIALLRPLHPSLARSAALACRLRAYPDALATRLLDGLLPAAPSALPADVYIQLLASLLCPRAGAALVAHGAPQGGSAEPLEAGFDRHRVIVHAVARWAHRFGPPCELVGVLEDFLVEEWGRHLELRTAASSQQQQQTQRRQEEGVRCAAYSLVAAGALAAGTWTPPHLAAVGLAVPFDTPEDSSSGSGNGSTVRIPPRLLEVLPAAMAELVSADVAEAAAAVAGPTGSDAALAAATGAAAAATRTLLGQLLVAEPGLALPLLQALATRAGAAETGTAASKQKQKQQPADPVSLAAAIEAAQTLLSHRALLPWWLKSEAAVRALSEQLSVAAAERREGAGDGRAAAACDRLAAAIEGMYAR